MIRRILTDIPLDKDYDLFDWMGENSFELTLGRSRRANLIVGWGGLNEEDRGKLNKVSRIHALLIYDTQDQRMIFRDTSEHGTFLLRGGNLPYPFWNAEIELRDGDELLLSYDEGYRLAYEEVDGDSLRIFSLYQYPFH